MSFVFNLLKNAFLGMLQLLLFGKRKVSNSLSIYVKTNTGNTLSVELDPKWDIKNLKEIVAPRMGIAPEDVKIIFAGKELHNSTIIEVSQVIRTVLNCISSVCIFNYTIDTHFISQECDLGQQSILHAVKMPHKIFNKKNNASNSIEETTETSNLNDSGSKPMNETLKDLPLDESDRQNLFLEGGSNIDLIK